MTGSVLSSVAALAVAALRMRLRDLRRLLINPLALVISAVIAMGYVWLLATQSDAIADEGVGFPLAVAGFAFVLSIVLVAFTAQRGSPLRLKPADVSWVLQSSHGPVVVLLTHSFATATAALVGATTASAVALIMRDTAPRYAIVSGLAVAGILLTIRAASLAAHLFGVLVRASIRRLVALALAALTCLWIVVFIASRFSWGTISTTANNVLTVAASPFQAVLNPEQGNILAGIVLLVPSALVLIFVTQRARDFIEPAVHESILANQLSKVLAGGQPSAVQGRGFKTGLPSVERWPQSPIGALLLSHLAQARRRRWQYVGSAVAMVVVVVVAALLGSAIPAGVGLIAVALLIALPAPSQFFAADLDHQHLPLSGVNLPRAGVAAVSANAGADALVAAPSVVLGVALIFGAWPWVPLYLITLAVYCLCASFAGIGARAFSDSPVGRSIAAVAMCLIPLLLAVSAADTYGSAEQPLRLWVILTGTLTTAIVLYSGVSFAVVSSVHPGNGESGRVLVDAEKAS